MDIDQDQTDQSRTPATSPPVQLEECTPSKRATPGTEGEAEALLLRDALLAGLLNQSSSKDEENDGIMDGSRQTGKGSLLAGGGGAGDDESSTAAPHRRRGHQLYRIYISHFLSAWGDRMWEFAIALFLIDIWPDSLLLPAVYGLVMSMSIILGGGIVGRYVDTRHRLHTMKMSLAVQNFAVFACGLCVLLLITHEKLEHSGTGFGVLVALMLLTAAIGNLASLASTLSVEKDWVVTICAGQPELLAQTNARLRRIDLTCKILAPTLVGILIGSTSVLVGAIFIVVWNMASWVPEYMLLKKIFVAYPKLHEKDVPPQLYRTPYSRLICEGAMDLVSGWRIYMQQTIVRPGLALALLYCTVLSFGSIMTAYVYSRGMHESVLGAVRGVGAVFGITATFVFPRLRGKVGVAWSGMLSIWLQLFLLGFCLVGSFLGHGQSGDCTELAGEEQASCERVRNAELGLLCTGVVLSRVGLWMFDLSVTQMLQEFVPVKSIGVINGVQNSCQNVMDLLSYLLGIVFSDPASFRFLVAISFIMVLLAALLYSSFFFSSSLVPPSGISARMSTLESQEDNPPEANGTNQSMAGIEDGCSASDSDDDDQAQLLSNL